jgi:hypothetical protein
LKKYLQLAALIFKNGTLRHSGQNFNFNRAKSLENLQEFIPPHVLEYLQVSKPNPSTKSLVKSLVRQAAFIKYAFRNDGGHLNSQNLSYIRIPKAANTSLSYAMLSKKYPDLQEKNPDEYQINFLADVNLLPAMKVKTDTIFTVVRNPFARLVSVYRDFFETKRTEFIYADYLFGILPQKISFAEFVSRISRIPDRLKDQHIKPQHLFVKPYESKGITVKYFQLETPSALEGFLKEHGMELTHHNKSREAYDYTQYYDVDLLQQVYEIYEADIKKFGYQLVYQDLKQLFQS